MTSLSRAKSCLNRIALQLVPLALAAVSAHAAVVFTPLNSQCVGGGSNGGTTSGSVTMTSLPELNTVAGVKGHGNCSYTSNSAPAFDDQLQVEMNGSGDGSTLFEVSFLPVAWNFTPNSTDLENSMQWRLNLNINGNSWLLDQGLVDPGDQVVGATDFDLSNVSEGYLDTWSLVLTIRQDSFNESPVTLSVDVPMNSLDINPIADTPEPGTILLLAGGLAAVGLRRKFAAGRA